MSEFSITPLYDIDVYHVLPYLRAIDLHFLLQTNKTIRDKNVEFKNQLMKYRMNTFMNIKYIQDKELNQVTGLLNICLDDKNKDYTIEKLLELEYVVIEYINSIIKKTNPINKDQCYLTAIHKNERTNTIIYNRYIKIVNNIMLLYCK